MNSTVLYITTNLLQRWMLSVINSADNICNGRCAIVKSRKLAKWRVWNKVLQESTLIYAIHVSLSKLAGYEVDAILASL